MSKKRAVENRAYSPIAAKFKREHPICQVCQKAPTSDVHHKNGRRGKNLCDSSKFLAVCRPCHEKIHYNPNWARAEGHLTHWERAKGYNFS